MARALWFCLLCLNGCLLVLALDCKSWDDDCDSAEVTEVKANAFTSVARAQKPNQKQQGAQLTQRHGSHAMKKSPNTLAQAERLRRHSSGSKKKPHRPRISLYTLLSHNPETNPLQVERVHRTFERSPYPKLAALKSFRKRSRRSAAKKKSARNNTCS